jgi:hypothetical protein
MEERNREKEEQLALYSFHRKIIFGIDTVYMELYKAI